MRIGDKPRSWLKHHWRAVNTGVVLTCVGIALAATSTILATFKWLRWLWIVVAAIGAAVLVIVALRESWIRRTEARERVASWPLPRVSEIDPYNTLGLPVPAVGAAPSQLGELRPSKLFPYVGRDIDGLLQEFTRRHSFVLLIGESKAGKTRSAYEAALATWPNRRIIVSRRDDPGGLTAMMDQEGTRLREMPILLWLDDIEDFLQPDGLSTQLLDRLQAGIPDLRVLATITTRAHREISGVANSMTDSRSEALRRFVSLRVPLLPTDKEREEFHRQYPAQSLTGGFGEHFIAAHELVRRFEDGNGGCPHEHTGVTCPVSRALVEAAVDWRRAGMVRPIPEDLLKLLYAVYAQKHRPSVELTDEHYESAIRWAINPIASHIALLERVIVHPQDTVSISIGFRPFDYIVDYVDANGQPLEVAAWDILIENLAPSELNRVAQSAYTRNAADIARRAWERAVESNDSDALPEAAVNLGVLYDRERQTEKARNLWQRAIQSDRPRFAAVAANNIGQSFRRQGNFEAARQAYLQAASFGQQSESGQALLNLGNLCKEHGDVSGAREAFSSAIANDDDMSAPAAAYNLVLLLIEQQDLDEAKKALQYAIEKGDPYIANGARLNLAIIREWQKDSEGAVTLYQQVLRSGVADFSEPAGLNLGLLLATSGNTKDAEAYLLTAVDSEIQAVFTQAAINLGWVYGEQGRIEEAKDLYRRVIESGDPAFLQLATGNLGILIEKSGDLDKAKLLYEQMIKSNHPDEAPRGWVLLGNLYRDQGDHENAKRAYEHAIESGHHEEGSKGAFNLGSLLSQMVSIDAASDAFQKAIEFGHPEISLEAAKALADLLSRHGRLDQSIAAHRTAGDLGDAKAHNRANYLAAVRNAVHITDEMLSNFILLPISPRPLLLAEFLIHGLEYDPDARELLLGRYIGRGMVWVNEWPAPQLPRLNDWTLLLNGALVVVSHPRTKPRIEEFQIPRSDVPDSWAEAVLKDGWCAVMIGVGLGLAEPDPEQRLKLIEAACKRSNVLEG